MKFSRLHYQKRAFTTVSVSLTLMLSYVCYMCNTIQHLICIISQWVIYYLKHYYYYVICAEESEIVTTSTTTTTETSTTMRKRRSRNTLKIAYIFEFRILKLPWNVQGVDSFEQFWLIILLCNRMSILYAIIQKCMGSFFSKLNNLTGYLET